MSPAEVLFGHPLRDTLPLIHKDVDTFHNNQFANHSREAWRLKEQLLKTQYIKSLENLADHSHPLPPLTIGYNIFIQNQTGQFPIHWDHSGTVVNVKGHDQYVVKVAGTGMLTLHNRRFLKIFKAHLLFGSDAAQSHHSSQSDMSAPAYHLPFKHVQPPTDHLQMNPHAGSSTPTQRLLRQQMYNHTFQHQRLVFREVFRYQIWIAIYHLTHQCQRLFLQGVFRCQIWPQTPRNSQHCYADLLTCKTPQNL